MKNLAGLSLLITVLAYSAGHTGDSTVRPPAVAGAFYPGDSANLARTVNDHLRKAESPDTVDGDLLALIVPHAGLVYSGQIAAHSYKLLESLPVRTVVLCGPSHRFGFEGVSVYGPDIIWQTPLGKVACDDDICRKLIAADRQIEVIPQAHAREHCLEVQLPYLQTALSDFRIVPMVMGRPRAQTIDRLARALETLPLGKGAVLVASSDWQHYKPAAQGWKLDSVGIECIKALDADRLQKALGNGKVEACGGAAVAAVIKATVALGADKVQILKYGDSGDVSGDKESVVGYLAAAIYRSGGLRGETLEQTTESNLASLTDDEKKRLLEIARESIHAYLTTGVTPDFDVPGKFRQDGAAFVTLTRNGRLRGCIGHTVATQPLVRTVAECAVSAAVSDPRFPPVKQEELGLLDIEISVLTPLEPVRTLEDILVGRDGLMIVKGRHRGLLLPQVAKDYGWTREEFLRQTCRKAGLAPRDYLAPDATVYRFQALVFSEHDLRSAEQ